MTARTSTPPKTALVVASDLEALTAFQSALTSNGYVAIIARDLPTALLAITQHYFDVAIVSSRLGEGGDGWPLAGVLHLVFPRAFIAVLTPGEPDVVTFQSAINNGVSEIYEQSRRPAEIVGAITGGSSGGTASSGQSVQ
ncbi:MAG TPA: response regulator [Terriglobales bacterium]|jgi:DNA-binding NtrC family response regulator|nr:response regulator [Terriglobales bacterium]